MSLPIQVALVPDSGVVDLGELTQVAGALSKQVQQDFGPIWSVQATVDPYTRLEDMPLGAWPIIITTQNLGDAAGFHTNRHGHPMALVELDSGWSITASHECLEMLADPSGRRSRTGNLLDQALGLGLNPGRVHYLLEVCDPSEAGQFSYQVNGLTVSDFYTPHFFEPVKASGLRYSFTGAITTPRTILDGGYITWHDPVSRHTMQLRMFPDEFSAAVPHILDLTSKTTFEKLLDAGESVRSAVDRVTRPPKYKNTLVGEKLLAARVNRDSGSTAQAARAEEIRSEIKERIRSSAKTTAAPKRKRR